MLWNCWRPTATFHCRKMSLSTFSRNTSRANHCQSRREHWTRCLTIWFRTQESCSWKMATRCSSLTTHIWSIMRRWRYSSIVGTMRKSWSTISTIPTGKVRRCFMPVNRKICPIFLTKSGKRCRKQRKSPTVWLASSVVDTSCRLYIKPTTNFAKMLLSRPCVCRSIIFTCLRWWLPTMWNCSKTTSFQSLPWLTSFISMNLSIR